MEKMRKIRKNGEKKLKTQIFSFVFNKIMIRPLWKSFTYFPHQLDGIKWMLHNENGVTLEDSKDIIKGGLQCDDMGLGKTIQIASVIINNVVPLTLLIAPLAMIDTWSSVLQRTGCSVYHIDSGKWVLINPDSPIPRHFIKLRPIVYISNYEKLYRNPSLFSKTWGRVVLDEAHKIRNGDGQIAIAARKIVAPIRWAVTGTPLVNSLKDVVSLLAFIGVSHSVLWRWEPRYIRMLPDLLIHRDLRSINLSNAPPLPEIYNVELPFTSEEEEDFYYGVQDITSLKYATESISSTEAFKLLLRLRQISVHPQVYINAKRRESLYLRPDWSAPSTKLDKIKEIITSDVGVHKYIIFCQFNDEMALLEEFLRPFVKHILLYNGSMTQKERGDVLDRSKETVETTVLLLQLQAGGVGLNLQEYDRIIFVSPWWTSALIDQAIARAVRMGQTEVVKIYHLHLSAEKTSTINIDSLVNSKAEEKRKMLVKLFEVCQ